MPGIFMPENSIFSVSGIEQSLPSPQNPLIIKNNIKLQLTSQIFFYHLLKKIIDI